MNTPDPELSLSDSLESILSRYATARQEGQFGSDHPLWKTFSDIQAALEQHPSVKNRPHLKISWSVGQGNWARVPWIAFLDERETTTTQQGTYVVLLFRQDMTGVYLTFNQGVTELKKRHGTREARSILQQRAERLRECLPQGQKQFRTDDGIDLHTDASLGRQYESSTAAYRLYEHRRVPSDFEIYDDLEVLLKAYDEYLNSDLPSEFSNGTETESAGVGPTSTSPPKADFVFADAAERLHSAIRARGFIYQPWQIAQYIAAVRTKPFVILAGVTGTGKSKLPRLVAEATGGEAQLVPVRPDWTDSAEVLGYTDLEGVFRPGAVLETAHTAMAADDVHWTCIVDEMNLARVEHYFAEVLSRIEDRRPAEGGGFLSSPLIQTALQEDDAEWGKVHIPPNLALVGTVNMDESAHGFSRKVLDRAFTLELSDVALSHWPEQNLDEQQSGEAWPVGAWWPRATRLSGLTSLTLEERTRIKQAIDHLVELNEILAQAQLQVGYRTRDEIALFLLHAEDISSLFRTEDGGSVDPLDLALEMKILPRIAGGSSGVRRVLLGLLGWSHTGSPLSRDEEARDLWDRWDESNRPSKIPGTRFPGVAGRVLLMWDRLQSEGFTSYWL